MNEQQSLFGAFEAAQPIIVFDIETQNLFDDVGGAKNVHLLKLSVAVTYNVDTGEYKSYTEEQAQALIDELCNARLVVGYNIIKFDYRVLQVYTERKLDKLPTLDLLDHLYRTLGFRVSLDSAASATLGAQKTADGLLAVQWWRSGQVEKVREYCQADVRLTNELYQFGKEKGYVLISDRMGGVRRVAVNWR